MLAGVNAVTEDTQLGCMNQGVNMEFARLRALGAGVLRAQSLDGELHVWGQAAGGAAFPATADAGAAQPAAAQESYAIRAMLFGDVKGYSKLSDVELLQFARQYERRVAEVLVGLPREILSRRTAGDGIFLVFADLRTPRTWPWRCATWSPPRPGTNAACRRTWASASRWMPGPSMATAIPSPGSRRSAASTSTGRRGSSPSRRPTRCTPSAAFAALHVATCRPPLRFEYVGQTELPKGFGWAPLYGCQREAGRVQAC